jgi:hypothetical protein
MKSLKMPRFTGKSIPIAFAIITIAAYGLLLPVTGFYWDDWPFAWIARFLGSAEFIPAFRGFRPFLGPIFFLTTSLLPPDPQLWQVFGLLIRFCSALSVWFALRVVWPQRQRQALMASLLFLVFPGYSQQWVALTHINQEWIPFICYLVSFGLTARALRTPKHRGTLSLVALLLMLPGLLPTEYFIGLEPMRLMFVWVILGETIQDRRRRLAGALRIGAPYLLLWLLDLAWLLYYYRSGLYISYDLTASATTPAFGQIAAVFGDALWKAGLFVWIQILPLLMRSITTPTSLLTLGLIGISFTAAVLYLRQLDNPLWRGAAEIPEPRAASTRVSSFALQSMFIGAAGILLGRTPSFGAGLPLTLQSSFDRLMISMMFGASLLIVGLIEFVLRDDRRRDLAVAALLSLAIGQQFFNANIFRRDWQRQQEIYWQFAWRMPGIEPGTAVITQQMPLDYETDLSMTAALNWIYAPETRPTELAYALIYSEKRLGGVVLPNLDAGSPIQMPFRTVAFSGNTSKAIVIYVPQTGCLRVLDPQLGDEETYSRFPDSVVAPIPLSDPGRILAGANPPVLPDPPFESEPSHRSWCYFYEKAELARQAERWDDIVTLQSQAQQIGLTPSDPIEWLPFLEAETHRGDAAIAAERTRQLSAEQPRLRRGLCILWERIGREGPPAAQTVATQLIGELACGQ